jgi:hypothetical protein
MAARRTCSRFSVVREVLRGLAAALGPPVIEVRLYMG